eukprot:355301-Chlamydomonas_euryale.AAC.5
MLLVKAVANCRGGMRTLPRSGPNLDVLVLETASCGGWHESESQVVGSGPMVGPAMKARGDQTMGVVHCAIECKPGVCCFSSVSSHTLDKASTSTLDKLSFCLKFTFRKFGKGERGRCALPAAAVDEQQGGQPQCRAASYE